MADSYNLNDALQISGVKKLAQRISARLTALEQGANAFQALKVEGNTVKFFTTTDTTATAAYSFDFPEELFLDQLGTGIVKNFTFSALTYPDTENPNLDGKTVFVLAVKGDKTPTPTVKYSFVDASDLVDISGKVNKFSGATAGNICVFDSDGGVSDTGVKFATDAEFTAMLDEVFPYR